MSRANAIILGVLSVIPLVYLPLVYGPMLKRISPHDLMSLPFFAVMGGAALLAILTMWYARHAQRQLKPGAARIAWIVVILLGNFLVFPVYWYLHIWREVRGSGRAL